MNNVSKVKGYQEISIDNLAKLESWLKDQQIITCAEAVIDYLNHYSQLKVEAESEVLRGVDESSYKYEESIRRVIDSVTSALIGTLERKYKIPGKFTMEINIIGETVNNGMKYHVVAEFKVYG